METTHPDFLLCNYRFELPAQRIAQAPAFRRADARLMVLDRCRDALADGRFSDLAEYLPKNCLLVANNSRVVPARLFGRRPGGGALEMLLLTPPPLLVAGAASSLSGVWSAEAESLMRPAAKLHPGDICPFAPELEAEVLERGPAGRCRVSLRWRGVLQELLERLGCLPLPPYIRRPRPGAPDADVLRKGMPGSAGRRPGASIKGEASRRKVISDAERYQTVYARRDKAGSVAAPTAGLHFTVELRDRLRASGREWAELTLYVGYGTFSPVRCRDIREHVMHREHAEVPAGTAAALQAAAAAGRPIIAVGTTTARVLEAVFAAQNPAAAGLPASDNAPVRQNPAAYRRERDERLRARRQAVFSPFAGDVNIFLYPGKDLNVVDGLITNFHLPESTLLLLVSAMAGRERILAAYREALVRGFNFFSYGDAMLIL
ncbi:MAG: S-adenosylmethionine:tRNA ribosyltransferase-isomerase [Desulfovibrio sp.]|jgi:S-adenosylmethionine:tRNA ribosyltransferase-isomerase|nr:S-adenosylmethionine:tRNA ribosyltransferase-isomerase [Desulfovibrio sp.]